jgi:protein-tyrosine-phosphatase
MTGTPTVLFVCPHNANRSQIAAGYLQHLAGASTPRSGKALMPCARSATG